VGVKLIYIISTLFSVLLGAISASIVKVEHSSSPPGAKTYSLVTRHNLFRITCIFVLFLLDWLAFGFVYPPSKPFMPTWIDAALFALYLPALVALTSSVMLSFGDGEEYCKPLIFYHVSAGLAEVAWLVWLVQVQGNQPQAVVSLLILVHRSIHCDFLSA